MWKGCRSGAAYGLRIVVPDLHSEETSAEGLLGAEVCARHMLQARSRPVILSDEMRANLWFCAAFMTEPDFGEAYIEDIPLGGVVHRAFRSLPRPH